MLGKKYTEIDLLKDILHFDNRNQKQSFGNERYGSKRVLRFLNWIVHDNTLEGPTKV